MATGIEAERGAARRASVFIVTIGCLVMLGVALYYLANAMLVEALNKAAAARTPESGTNGMEKDRTEETMKFMRALKDNPNDLNALVGLAHIFLHNNDSARAEVFFARAAKLAPDNASILRGLALAQMENNRLAEAEASLQHALEHGHDTENHYLLAVVYSRQLPEKKDQALQQCDAVLADANASAMLRGHAESLRETVMKTGETP